MTHADQLMARVRQAFNGAFGVAPALVARAPGRVNLIGEHTDYNDGFVLPAAISVQTLVAARPRPDGVIRVVAADFDGVENSFALDAPILPDAAQGWANHVRGVAASLQARGLAVPGVDLAIAGNIPRGSGLSSSASLAVAVGTALSELGGLGLDATTIAQVAQASECDFVGVKCGIMDQLASARGVADHALLIDCRSLECRPVRLPEGLAILIVHSGVTRGLVEGHYNERRAQCEAAAAAMRIAALRDSDLGLLDETAMPALTAARARHVITENARTLAAAEALERGDLVALGELMRESHASMRDDFAITVPAVDALAAELQQRIGREGGARMTGGGFGGAVVALLAADRAREVAGSLAYRTPAGETPLVLIEQARDGAGVI